MHARHVITQRISNFVNSSKIHYSQYFTVVCAIQIISLKWMFFSHVGLFFAIKTANSTLERITNEMRCYMNSNIYK